MWPTLCVKIWSEMLSLGRHGLMSWNRAGGHCAWKLIWQIFPLLSLVVRFAFPQPVRRGVAHPLSCCVGGTIPLDGQALCCSASICHHWNKGFASQLSTVVSLCYWSISTVLVSLLAALATSKACTLFSNLCPSAFAGRQAFTLLML